MPRPLSHGNGKRVLVGNPDKPVFGNVRGLGGQAHRSILPGLECPLATYLNVSAPKVRCVGVISVCFACFSNFYRLYLHNGCCVVFANLIRATSHTRLRARDHYTSSTFIGGIGGAGPSSMDTILEGPTEYLNARWM